MAGKPAVAAMLVTLLLVAAAAAGEASSWSPRRRLLRRLVGSKNPDKPQPLNSGVCQAVARCTGRNCDSGVIKASIKVACNGIGLCVDGGCVMPPSPVTGLVGAPGAAPAPGPQTSLVFTGMTPGPVTASNSAASSYVITCVVGFEALLSQLPAYSSASFTSPPTAASPVVISGLPSSTGFTCYVVASNAGGILTSSSTPGLMLATAPFAPNAPSAPKVKATMNSISGKWDVSATDASHDAPSFYTMRCVQGSDSSAAPCNGPSEGDWPASGTVSGGSVTATLISLRLATSYMCYAIATNTAGEACSSGTPVTTEGLPQVVETGKGSPKP